MLNLQRTALENYLAYYKTCTAPGYAVLVVGQSGCGKTHQVKQALGGDCYYVSLYGLQSSQEVNAAVYAQMNVSRPWGDEGAGGEGEQAALPLVTQPFIAKPFITQPFADLPLGGSPLANNGDNNGANNEAKNGAEHGAKNSVEGEFRGSVQGQTGKALAANVLDTFHAFDATQRQGGECCDALYTPSTFRVLEPQGVRHDKVLVFDDLEMSGFKGRLPDLFGVINQYVEHHHCCVVVISRHEEFEGILQEDMEKVFGQVIHIEPQTQQAAQYFIEHMSHAVCMEFLAQHREQVLEVFAISGASSLRILLHVFEDLARLRLCIPDVYVENAHAMRELVGVFAALNVEVRLGHMGAEDILHYVHRVNAFKNAVDKQTVSAQSEDACVRFYHKYAPVIEANSRILSAQVLVHMLCSGCYEPQEIVQSLNQSFYFDPLKKLAPWKIIINMQDFDDAQVEQALVLLQEQFKAHQVSNIGDMLHTFAVMLWGVEQGLLTQEASEVIARCQAYIDALFEQGRLEFASQTDAQLRWEGGIFEGYAGHAYRVPAKYRVEFAQVCTYLLQKWQELLWLEAKKQLPMALELLKADGRAFYKKVCVLEPQIDAYDFKAQNACVQLPILAQVPAGDFVALWMQSAAKNWYWITQALLERYTKHKDERKSEQGWQKEVDWINEVVLYLGAQKGASPTVRRLRLMQLVQLMRSVVD